MRRVVQQVNCAHWRGTHRLEGGFGFSGCHRPPRRQTLRELGGAGGVAAAHGLRRLAAAVADGPGWNRAFHQRNRRDAFHRVPWPGWNRALHRIVTTGPGCNPAFQGDAISTGGSRGAWGWSCRRAVAGGETVAQRGGPSGGAPAAEGGSECATAEGTAGQRGGGGDLRAVSVPVQAHGAVLESGRG